MSRGPGGADPRLSPRAASRARPAGAPHFYGAAVVVLFSSFVIVSKLGLASSLAPWDLAALRFGVSGAVMLPFLVRRGFRGIALRRAVGLAFFGGVGFAACAYAGFALAPSSHGAVLLHGTLAVTTCVLMLASSARPPRPSVPGLAAIALGVLAMASESARRTTGAQLIGDGALLLASFSWSAYGLLARRSGVEPVHAASIVAVLSMCIYLPIYCLLPHEGLTRGGVGGLLAQALFQGIALGVASIFVYTKAVSALGPRTLATLTAAVPGLTTAAGIGLLHETPSALSWIGVALVSAGMVVALRAEAKQTHGA